MPQPVPIHMVVRDYDIVGPIAKGDVVPEGIELTLDRTAPIASVPQRRLVSGGRDVDEQVSDWTL